MSRRARQRELEDVPGAVPPLSRDTAGTPVVSIAMGHLRDGRHAVAELHLLGGKVVGGSVLCAATTAQHAGRAWLQCAYARLGEQRLFSDVERAVNEREGTAKVEDFSHGVACSMSPHGQRRFIAAHAEVSEGLVSEPKLLCIEDRLSAWSVLSAWAARHLLPRRKA